MPKEKYKKKPFESTGISSDTSANIYMSMMMSDAWNDLSKNQRLLYLYCKAQYYGEKRKTELLDRMNRDNPDKEYKDATTWFTMNRGKYSKLYKLYAPKGGQTKFIKDMEALIEKGFIKKVSSGKTTREKAIYRYSSQWQNYKSQNI